MKRLLRALFLKAISPFFSKIRDHRTGEVLGKGWLVPLGGRVRLIGYRGRPLIPEFLPQQRLCFWKQEIGFTARGPVDFPSDSGKGSEKSSSPRVLHLVITHRGGEEFVRLLSWWKPFCSQEDLWVVFGGTRGEFEALEYPRKVFVDDPGLRTQDHQREKQSYAGILKATAPIVERESPDYVYLCEYDHLPVQADFMNRQLRELREEGADVMAHYLERVDGTSSAFALFHDADPAFSTFWKEVSRRDDPSAVLWMFGSGSLWTREAYLAVATGEQRIPCYFEVYLPTLAHHLGFRVRRWKEDSHLVTNLPSADVTVETAASRGAWTVHPVKQPPRGSGNH